MQYQDINEWTYEGGRKSKTRVVTDGAETVISRGCFLATESECSFTNLGWHRRISCPGIRGIFCFLEDILCLDHLINDGDTVLY